MSIVVKPIHAGIEPEYGKQITSLKQKIHVDFNDGSSDTDDDLVDYVEQVPTWNEPPDLEVQLAFVNVKATYPSGWARDGSKFSKSGQNINHVHALQWFIRVKPPWSTRKVKIVNPYGYYIKASIYGVDSSDVLKGSQYDILIPPGQSREPDVTRLIAGARDAGAEALLVIVSLYDVTITDNYISVASNTIYTVFPGVNPTDGTPIGPTVAFDMYNCIDRYGLAISGVAAAFAGVGSALLTQTKLLADDPIITQIAANTGATAAEAAGIIMLGLSQNWLTMGDIPNMFLPTVAGMLGAGVGAGYLTSVLPNKYQSIFTGVTTGAITFGGAMILLTMIDDVSVEFQV